ncbi:hypothetical protein JT359_19690 [Candidatus Poribacteria bacterium]|nr:hypothetical protein [Candidatus Poribacteria bacterium]
MIHGTVDVKLKPIKLAFLVNPEDKVSLQQAIEINTFLWGGMYNPIIPTYKELPTDWQDAPNVEKPSAQELISGYLDNFDPIYVIPMGVCSNYPIEIDFRQKINEVSDFYSSYERYKTPNYGISIFEVLEHFFNDEFRFHQRNPHEISIPQFDQEYKLLLSSVFGKLPDEYDVIFWDDLAERFDAKLLECSMSNYVEFFEYQKLFFLRITDLYINVNGRGKKCLFFFDADRGLDIIDFWNLRAVGWEVLPIPMQFTISDETKESILNYITKNYLSLSNTTILKSRSISESEYQCFLDLFEKSMRISQTWYPPIWNITATDSDYEEDIRCCELTSDSVERDLSTRIHFYTHAPKFLKNWHDTPCYANEIKWSLQNEDNTPLAAIIPGAGGELAQFIAGAGYPEEWHLSDKSLVYLCQHTSGIINIVHPQAEAIFMKWLELNGWSAKLSSAGRVAKQMLLQLQGIRGADILAKKGIIKLLDEMNRSEGKYLLEENIRGKVQAIENQQSIFSKILEQRILQPLITSKIFQLGMRIQCPVCIQHSWYSVKDVNYVLQCPECLENLSFPYAPKEQIKWAYRTIGPFSSSNQAHGAYTVLLTLRFFHIFRFSGSVTTPLLSFKAEKNGIDIEADLAIFFQESRFLYPKTELIFVECKTFNSFNKKDTERMLNLGEQFPDAYLVFATLKESLNEDEKEILREVANYSQENRKNKCPFNPIMILTETELISDSHFELRWERTKDIRTTFVNKHNFEVGRRFLLDFCNVTQQVYLDMELSDEDYEDPLQDVNDDIPF